MIVMNTVSAETREVPDVLGDHDARSRTSPDLSDVTVVDAAAGDPAGGDLAEELLARTERQILDDEPRQNFMIQQQDRVRGLQAILRRQAGCHGVELEATVPCRARLPNAPLRDGGHDALRRFTD